MTTSRKPQPADRQAFDPARVTHLFDCMCPYCTDETERPDFTAAAKRAVEQNDQALLGVGELPTSFRYSSTNLVIDQMHNRLARYQALNEVWQFPDHFTVTTSRSPAVRDSARARFLVTMHNVLDERGHAVATLDRRLHAGGRIANARTRTCFDLARLNPEDPDSPVSVGLLREWFDLDQTTVGVRIV